MASDDTTPETCVFCSRPASPDPEDKTLNESRMCSTCSGAYHAGMVDWQISNTGD